MSESQPKTITTRDEIHSDPQHGAFNPTPLNDSEIPDLPIRYKSLDVQKLEEREGEEIETIIARHYLGGQTGSDVGSKLNLSTHIILKWLKYASIKPRKGDPDPAYKDKRINSLRTAWNERKTEIVAKIHTPESDNLRSIARLAYNAANPEKVKEQIENSKRSQQKKKEEKRKQDFGDDIEQGLIDMHHRDGLTIAEIAGITNRSESEVVSLFKELNVKMTPLTDIKSKEAFQEVQRLAWENPSKLQLLTHRQRKVIYLRHLANPEAPIPTFDEAAKILGTTKQNIHEAEKYALTRLRTITSDQ